MSVSEAFRGVIDESAAPTESAPAINGFTSNLDAGYVATTGCGRRSTICWRAGPATLWSCAPSATMKLSSKSVIG